eukprot:5366773-Pleurochrysis_carterae.AAC.1
MKAVFGAERRRLSPLLMRASLQLRLRSVYSALLVVPALSTATAFAPVDALRLAQLVPVLHLSP